MATVYGVIRIPTIQLTDDEKKAAGLDKPASAAMHESRIAALEAKNQTLKAENAQLRRQGVAGGAAPSKTAAHPASLAPDKPKSPVASQDTKIPALANNTLRDAGVPDLGAHAHQQTGYHAKFTEGRAGAGFVFHRLTISF